MLFLFGGSSRADEPRFLLAEAGMAVTGCLGLFLPAAMRVRVSWSFTLAIMLIMALHLAPLPAGLWRLMPGRELPGEILDAAGLGQEWHPISLTPDDTLSALAGMLTPVTALILFSRVTERHWPILVGGLLALSITSGIAGLIQALAGADLFYFYRVTNPEAAVGLLANRNHQAALLASILPMLATIATTRGGNPTWILIRKPLAALAALFVVPLILVTGSRTGLALMALAIAAGLALLRKARPDASTRRAHRRWPGVFLAAILAGAGAIVFAALHSNRDIAIARLGGTSLSHDQRFLLLGPMAAMAREYFPVGAGFGSFVSAFKIAEPLSNLNPAYWNHAHNDFLELAIEAGLPGVVLLTLFVAWWGTCSLSVWRGATGTSDRMSRGRLGSIIIALLGVASLTDYPLRTPILTAEFILACLMLECARASRESVDARNGAL